MSIQTTWVSYGQEHGFFAFPERARAPLPAVIVIQEAWGVDAHIEDVARRYAGAGYAAFAPDLYAQGGTRPEPLSRERLAKLQAFVNTMPARSWTDPEARKTALASYAEPDRNAIEESLGAMMGKVGKPAELVPKLLEAARFLRTENELTRGAKVVSVGYCLGGGLSGLLACHDPELAAAAIYYGTSPPADLIPKIACPVVGLYGGNDARVNATIPAFEEAMKAHGKRFAKHVYDGAEHAFNNDGRPSYDARAARDAFRRTLDLFGDALG